MEIKINREIRSYTESVFFGLSLRQCVCALLAMGVAAGLWFLLRTRLGTETVSWLCILGAAPFAAAGFVTYHGMTAEQALVCWLRSEIFTPVELPCVPVNVYWELWKDRREDWGKEDPAHDAIGAGTAEDGQGKV